MSDSREAMRAAVEALMYVDLALDSALQYPDFDCDNQDEPRPLCSLLTQAREKLDAALSLLRAALEAREERCTYPECSCEQPEHGGCGHPHAYTEAIGEAGEDYHRQFMNAHPLPAQWRWSELWGRMLAASPAAATQGDAREPSGETMEQREEVCAAWHALPDELRKAPGLTRLYHALGGPRMEDPGEAAIGAESEQATEDGRNGT